MKNNQNKLLEYYRSCPQQYSPEALSQCKKTPASLSIELSRVSVCTYWLSHSPPKSLCTAQFNSQIKTSSCLITYFPVLTWISIVLVRTSLKVSRVWKLVNIIKQSASVNKRGLLLAISAPSHTHTHTFFFPPFKADAFSYACWTQVNVKEQLHYRVPHPFQTNPESAPLRGIKINMLRGHCKLAAGGNAGLVRATCKSCHEWIKSHPPWCLIGPDRQAVWQT